MQSKLCLRIGVPLFFAAGLIAADTARDWQSGTLVETEKEEVRQGSTKTTNSEIKSKNKGSKTGYEETSRSTTTENYDHFQVYTIQGERTMFVAREKLLFPWSKPASVTVGAKLKFAVEKNTMYILGEDGKQHKAGIRKATASVEH